MAESGKKLSFVFSKVSKRTKSKVKEDVQYIDCLDSKAIVCKKYVFLFWLWGTVWTWKFVTLMVSLVMVTRERCKIVGGARPHCCSLRDDENCHSNDSEF